MTWLSHPPRLADPNLTRYLELWAVVQANMEDFTSWTSLITAAEKLVSEAGPRMQQPRALPLLLGPGS